MIGNWIAYQLRLAGYSVRNWNREQEAGRVFTYTLTGGSLGASEDVTLNMLGTSAQASSSTSNVAIDALPNEADRVVIKVFTRSTHNTGRIRVSTKLGGLASISQDDSDSNTFVVSVPINQLMDMRIQAAAGVGGEVHAHGKVIGWE